MDHADLIAFALGEQPADLLLKNAHLVNVLSGEIHPADIAVAGDRVAGLGESGAYQAREVVDLDGAYVLPGLIESHIHLESAMVRPVEFVRAVLPLGTTTVIYDPHEVANVLGLEGITYMHRVTEGLPVDFFAMLPSCVPATTMETAGASLTAEDIAPMLDEPWVLGLGEMMNYPGVLARDAATMAKLAAASGKRIDGHAPLLSGNRLNAYVAAGIVSDHETTGAQEAREKLRKGMHLMIREGTTEKNLDDLLPVITVENARRCFFASDDRHPLDLVNGLHIVDSVRRAIAGGLSPMVAVQMATINAAEYFRLPWRGAVAPGYLADLVVVSDLTRMDIRRVYKDGRLAALDGNVVEFRPDQPKTFLRGSINVRWIEPEDFYIPANGKTARVIGVQPGQITTRHLVDEVRVEGGRALADPGRDMLKIAVIERHRGSGNTSRGFVRGFGLKRGAIASSIAHDSHNIVVVGTNDRDMFEAAVRIVKLGGGLVVADDGETRAALRCPIAGLMSDLPLSEVARTLRDLQEAAARLGCILPDPFMSLSFLCLPVIPSLKITDRGLVDVDNFRFIGLFPDAPA